MIDILLFLFYNVSEILSLIVEEGEKMNNFKEKLISSLGVVGGIIYYTILIFIATLPIALINVPFWLSTIFIIIMFFFPASSAVFWIWGLISAICGPQDWLAIVYYIMFAVMFLPFFANLFIGIIGSLFNKK